MSYIKNRNIVKTFLTPPGVIRFDILLNTLGGGGSGGGSGSSSRFGFSGEDDSATGNRSFDSNGNNFSILNAGDITLDGVLKLPGYGSFANEGIPAYMAAFDSSGNLIETTASVTPTPPTFNWAVRDRATDRPVYALDDGDKFLVIATATGEFAGQTNKIAVYSEGGNNFSFSTPLSGDLLSDAASGNVYKYNGSSWVFQGKINLHQGGEQLGGFSSYGTIDNFPAEIKTNNVRRLLVRNNGQVQLVTAPTTYSSGSYDILVRNQTSRNIEKIVSTTFQPAITPGALTKSDDTNVTLTLGGTPATSLLQSTSLTLGWTGQLAVSRGGTGASTLTANNVILGNGTSAVQFVAPGSNGNVLTSNGSTWTSAAPSGGGSGTALGWFDAVATYGADNTGATDATTAIQNAINAAVAHGGGVVYLKNGTYAINGSHLTTDGTNPINTAQLYIPYAAWAGTGKCHVWILGESKPNEYTSRKQTVPVTTGVVIKSNSLAAAGCIFGAAYNTDVNQSVGLTFNEVTFENLVITVRSKTAGVDVAPTITGIGGLKYAMMNVKNVVVNTESAMTSSVTPLSTANGITCPVLGNWARINLDTVTVNNFYSGIVASEHTIGHNVYVATCVNGIEFATSAGHVAYFDKVLLQWNVNQLYISGTAYFKIDNLDLEDYTTAAGDPSKWYNTTKDIYEPSVTNSIGSVNFQRNRSNFGPDNQGFSVTTGLSTGVRFATINPAGLMVGAVNVMPTAGQGLYIIGPNDGKLSSISAYGVRDVAVFENNHDCYINLAAKDTNSAGVKFSKTAGVSENAGLAYNFNTNNYSIYTNLTSSTFSIGNGNGTLWNITSAGNLSGTGSAGTAYIHLKAGTATAGQAPMKFTSGALNTTPEIGALEYLTPLPYFTNDGGLRQQFTIGVTRKTTAQFNKTSDTTLADITGLGVFVVAGKSYRYEAELYTTSNVAGGVKTNISGSATATTIIYEAEVWQSGVPVATGAQRGTAFSAAVGDVTAVTTAKIKIKGIIIVNAAGYIIPQFAQNASNGTASSVLIGSTFGVYEMI